MSTGLHNTKQPPFMNLNVYDTPWNGMKAVSAKKKKDKKKNIKEKTQKQRKERKKKTKTYKQQILTSLNFSLFFFVCLFLYRMQGERGVTVDFLCTCNCAHGYFSNFCIRFWEFRTEFAKSNFKEVLDPPGQKH